MNRYFKINDFLLNIFQNFKEMAGNLVQSICKSNFAKWTREINLGEYKVDDDILAFLVSRPATDFDKLKVLKLNELSSLSEASIDHLLKS